MNIFFRNGNFQPAAVWGLVWKRSTKTGVIMDLGIVRRKLARPERGSKIEAAIVFVVAGFDGMLRIGKRCPTVIHSLRVGSQLERYGASIETVLAGYLHDVKEDTNCGSRVIFSVFGEEVDALVQACSENPRLAGAEKREDLFFRAETHGAQAIAIKVVDAADNFYSIDDLPREFRDELAFCSRRWLQLGEKYLGFGAPHCVELRNLLEKETQK